MFYASLPISSPHTYLAFLSFASHSVQFFHMKNLISSCVEIQKVKFMLFPKDGENSELFGNIQIQSIFSAFFAFIRPHFRRYQFFCFTFSQRTREQIYMHLCPCSSLSSIDKCKLHRCTWHKVKCQTAKPEREREKRIWKWQKSFSNTRKIKLKRRQQQR